MLARPKLDLHTFAVDFCLLVEDELVRGETTDERALRRASRLLRESLARMCRTVDEGERLRHFERARDACAQCAATVDALHRGGRLRAGPRNLAMALLGRLMERILDLAVPVEKDGTQP